jgi:hypothetical protein
MAPSSACPRPAEGQGLTVVSLDPGQSESTSARLVFDRGRGLVVEAVPRPGLRFTKGLRLMVMYAVRDAVFWMPARVEELLTTDRLYLMPLADPAELEKREFIRADVDLPAALVGDPAAPVAEDMPARRIELSASGFRWYGPGEYRAGDRVRLDLRLPGEARTLSIPAEVVRVLPRQPGREGDVAGRFARISADDRDAILACVFRVRHAELGLLDLESSFDH